MVASVAAHQTTFACSFSGLSTAEMKSRLVAYVVQLTSCRSGLKDIEMGSAAVLWDYDGTLDSVSIITL